MSTAENKSERDNSQSKGPLNSFNKQFSIVALYDKLQRIPSSQDKKLVWNLLKLYQHCETSLQISEVNPICLDIENKTFVSISRFHLCIDGTFNCFGFITKLSFWKLALGYLLVHQISYCTHASRI